MSPFAVMVSVGDAGDPVSRPEGDAVAKLHEEPRPRAANGHSNAKATRNLGTTIRPIAATWRRRVRTAYMSVHSETSLNDERRLTLERCIFEVQNELEHKRPDHPQVAVMNAVRNVLLDDIAAERGGNETWKHLRWPHVEAMAARIAGNRSRQPRATEAA